MHAPLPGVLPACSDASTSPQYLVTARRRNRPRRHLIARTPDPDAALACQAKYARLLARVMPAAGWQVSVHRLERLA